MSRLIVKNLPKNTNDEKLRKIFSEWGTVTDIQLKYTEKGKFRNFGFVGFQTEDEAAKAIKGLNQTFINTNKITVETCAALGDEKKPKSWSKYASDSTASKKGKKTKNTEENNDKNNEKNTKKVDEEAEILGKYKDDPLFEEFLQVHLPKEADKLKFNKIQCSINIEDETNKKSKINENKTDEEDEKEDDNEENEENNKLANEEISDLEYMKMLMKAKGTSESERKPRQKMEKKVKEKIELFTVKLRDLPYNVRKKDLKLFFKPLSIYSIRIPRNIHGIAYVGFKTEKLLTKALMKDRSFINGKQVSVVKYDNKTSDNDKEKDNEIKNNPIKARWKNQEEALKNEEHIAESGKIFVRNLAYTTTEDDIEKTFSRFGPLAEVNLPVDSTTRKIKGFGTLTFLMPEHAVKAYSELDGSILHGRMMHLLPGKTNDDTIEADLEESSNYKKKKAVKDKKQAGSSHNWNSLFLGHDAVAEVIAETYGTTKEAVVGPEGKGSAAVRLALGETQIVAQTRKYLEQNGVILDAFNAVPVKRSKTVILVKNLPTMTQPKELMDIFSKHGEIGRIILPPSGISAIVEFLEPSEARKAFTKLAYSKFKNAPLYLEWAPENSLGDAKEVPKSNEEDKKVFDNSLKDNKTEEIEDEPEEDTTLFVKNLNFKTTDDGLRKHFEGCGNIFSANVAAKKNKNDPNNLLSMGYGFVRFFLKASADKALKTLQQSVLDGKSLELKRSERTFKNDVNFTRKQAKKTNQTGTKLIVRNVPFQAKKQEIQELFSTFGEIKALRLPKKTAAGSDGHRGFAFVDFSTNSDAKAAFEALSQSTHLYGRRLVLEWAEGEENVEQIRKRTADHFRVGEEVKSKKSVFSLD